MAEKSITDLPKGMLTKILVRLPVKSLLQCQSVCKPWLSLISKPQFIKSQLHHAIIASESSPTLLSILNPPPPEYSWLDMTMEELEVDIVKSSSGDPQLQRERRRQLIAVAFLDINGHELPISPFNYDRLVIPSLFGGAGVIGSCNGIICLANRSGNVVYFWNPSMKRGKKIPDPQLRIPTVLLPVDIGAGYDIFSNDYKFIRIIYDPITDDYVRRYVQQEKFDVVPIVQVYSTNAGSWTDFRAPILNNLKSYRRTNIVVNGVMYVDAGDDLISFDLHTEAFGVVPFPSFVQRKWSDVLDFHDSVAMVFETGSGVDLWTLHDLSGELSWTKRFSVEAHPDQETDVWLSKYLGSGQFFGTKLLNRNMFLFNVLYDHEKKEAKIYQLGEDNVRATLRYTETLVSLDGFEHVE